MSGTKCEYNYKGSGRQVFSDKNTEEVLQAMFPIKFEDDFLGAYTAIPAAGSEESGCDWAKKIVGSGPPTVGLEADAAGGVAVCALSTDSEKQDAGLYFGDNRQFKVSQGLILQARVKLSVLPTLAGELVMGLWGDWKDGGSDYRIMFVADGNGELQCEVDDHVTETIVSSGVTLTTDDWAILMIDCTDLTNIKFFVNGSRVAETSTFAYAATGANLTLQPYFGGYKASGAGVGTLKTDFVKIFQNRS